MKRTSSEIESRKKNKSRSSACDIIRTNTFFYTTTKYMRPLLAFVNKIHWLTRVMVFNQITPPPHTTSQTYICCLTTVKENMTLVLHTISVAITHSVLGIDPHPSSCTQNIHTSVIFAASVHDKIKGARKFNGIRYSSYRCALSMRSGSSNFMVDIFECR